MAVVVLIIVALLFFWFRSLGSELNKFRSTTLWTVRREFNYNPSIPGAQKPIFDMITRQILAQQGNEFDAASAFMLTQCAALMRPLSQEARTFIEEKVAVAENLAPRGKFGRQFLADFEREDPRGKA